MKKILFSAIALTVFTAPCIRAATDKIERKVVLITGASRGTGKAIALQLAKSEKYIVYATMRKPVNLLPQNKLNNLFVLPLDVTKEDQCQKVVKRILQKEGRIDVLINNAAQGLIGCAETVEIQQAKALFDVNFFGSLRMIQNVLPSMRERKQGLLLTISSTGGIRPAPCWDLYVSTKFALEGLMECLATTVNRWNIQVSLIEPGLLATEFVVNTPVGTRLKDNPYKSLMNGMTNLTNSVIGSAQTAEEIAELVQKVIETEKPNLRYQTSPYSSMVATSKFVDPTGNNLRKEDQEFVEMLWSRG